MSHSGTKDCLSALKETVFSSCLESGWNKPQSTRVVRETSNMQCAAKTGNTGPWIAWLQHGYLDRFYRNPKLQHYVFILKHFDHKRTVFHCLLWHKQNRIFVWTLLFFLWKKNLQATVTSVKDLPSSAIQTGWDTTHLERPKLESGNPLRTFAQREFVGVANWRWRLLVWLNLVLGYVLWSPTPYQTSEMSNQHLPVRNSLQTQQGRYLQDSCL